MDRRALSSSKVLENNAEERVFTYRPISSPTCQLRPAPAQKWGSSVCAIQFTRTPARTAVRIRESKACSQIVKLEEVQVVIRTRTVTLPVKDQRAS